MGVHARHHIDASPRHVLYALTAQLFPSPRSRPDGPLECLSVRSAFDLLLTCAGVGPGDEILVTGVTHPDMVRIIEMHGAVAVPVDIGPGRMLPSIATIDRLRNERTKAVVHAHLFGARTDLGELAAHCREHGLMLIEDCAQSVRSASDRGCATATASLFSFGFIKTATAFGGALAHVHDRGLATAMRAEHSQWSVQHRREHAIKAIKALISMLLSTPLLYGLLVHEKHDPGAFTRTVSANDDDRYRQWLRRRPCGALVRTLRMRQRHFPVRRTADRETTGMALKARLPSSLVHPCPEDTSNHWLFPVLTDQPDQLSKHMSRAGFDAAPTTSQIKALDGAGDATDMMSRLVFLPAYPEIGRSELERMVTALQQFESGRVGVAATGDPPLRG